MTAIPAYSFLPSLPKRFLWKAPVEKGSSLSSHSSKVFPDICNGPATVEEPVEIYPAKLASPPTFKVEEALSAPVTFKVEAMVEEALEINPERLESPLTLRVEENVEEAEEINPFIKLASPPKIEVLETVS